MALRLNGRATDAQFAQNPLPIARSMGIALALVHGSRISADVASRTEAEVANALAELDARETPPMPFERVSREAIQAMLGDRPAASPVAMTHGAPIVANAVLVDSVTTFESAGTEGVDPPERDLAIAIRSIAETFTSEVSATFLEGYIEGGGALPVGPALDWYGLVAAFR